MNSPYQNPFETRRAQPLPRNYSEEFVAADYECKDSVELESYRRNLRNYLLSLLQQDPFPTFLFDKLEKRLDGITSILEKRSAASGALTKEAAQQRLKKLDERIQAADAMSQEKPEEERPAKRRRIDPQYVQEVRNAKNSLDLLRQQYAGQSQQQEEEEDETTLPSPSQ